MKNYIKIFVLIAVCLLFSNVVKVDRVTTFRKKIERPTVIETSKEKTNELPKTTEEKKSVDTQAVYAEQFSELIKIDCIGPFEGYGNCKYNPINVEFRDSSALEYLKTLSPIKKMAFAGQYSADGYKMSWELADRVCNFKNMRLPKAVELHNMYVAQKNGHGSDFLFVNYWAEEIGGHVAHNCHMLRGNCGQHFKKDLQRVRCVEK